MEFGVGILGPLDVTDGAGRGVDLGGPKQRELLAMLVIHVNRVVPAGRLVDALWGAAVPASVHVTLRTHVSRLRARLAAAGAGGALVTKAPGYGLFLDPEVVDVCRFERLLGVGQDALAAGQAELAAQLLREALGQWRGPVLDDLGAPPFAEAETARLDGLRLAAMEGRVEADLKLGRHHELVAELDGLVAEYPFRERFLGQLMLAQYRSGRQVDALQVYATARERLRDELGLDPGPELTELEAAILRHDPALQLPVNRVTPPPDALLAAVRRMQMVGRDNELAKLRELWRVVSEGGQRVVLISGEAGVGKTRLVAEFAHEADNAVFLVGRCDHASAFPYQPIAAALRANAEVDEILANAPETIRKRLAPLLDADDPGGGQEAFFEAVEWLVARIAKVAPGVLVVEDAERIDHASSRLLRHLVSRLPERFLVVVCFRDPPGTRHTPLLELLGDLESPDRLTLHPLAEQDLAALVTGLTGADAPAEFVQLLRRRTGGNPFYATEVVRDLEAGWQVPVSVRDVLRHRLSALTDPVQLIVRCAAVLGQEVEFDLLAELADQAEEIVIDSLDRAVGAGFLVEAGKSWKVSYAFPHDLMRDAVYADIALAWRQRLHLRAAKALEARGLSRKNDLAAAAIHLRQAGSAADPMHTAELSLRAAEEARRVYAWDEAIAHAEAAVEALDNAGAPPAQQGEAAMRTGMLRLRSSIGYPRAIRHLEAALRHYRAAGDDAVLGSVHSRLGAALSTYHSVRDIPRAIDHFAAAQRLLDDPKTVFHLHGGLSLAAMYGVRTELLGNSSQQAYDLAVKLGRRDLTAMAAWGRVWYRFNRGELAAGWALHEEIWATVSELGDPYLGWAASNSAAHGASEFLLDPMTAKAWCKRGLAQAKFDSLTYPHDTVQDQLVFAMAIMGEMQSAREATLPLPPDATSRRLLMFLNADWEQADRSWAAALDADEAAGDLQDVTVSARWLAEVRLLLGREADAIALLRRALTVGIVGPHVPTELLARARLARILAAGGDVDEAAAHLDRCEEILAPGERWAGQVGNIELARGAVAAAQGRQRDSDAAHEKALEIFTAYRLPWRCADALHSWASVSPDAAVARARHQASWAIYDEIGAAQRWRRPLA